RSRSAPATVTSTSAIASTTAWFAWIGTTQPKRSWRFLSDEASLAPRSWPHSSGRTALLRQRQGLLAAAEQDLIEGRPAARACQTQAADAHRLLEHIPEVHAHYLPVGGRGVRQLFRNRVVLGGVLAGVKTDALAVRIAVQAQGHALCLTAQRAPGELQ